MKILLTSIGARVELIEHLKIDNYILGVDSSENNCGKKFVDKFYKVPLCNNKEYIEELLKICRENNIDALIPLYEGEFIELIDNKEKFSNIGVKLILSDKKILELCKDKLLMNFELLKYDIVMPKVYKNEEINEIINNNSNVFPLIIKPREGMGSKDVFKLNNIKELIFFRDYVHKPIIQKFVYGQEYTVDILLDLKSNPIYIIPRKRIQVRSGEVVKSSISLESDIVEEVEKLFKELKKIDSKESVIGPFTVQYIRDDNGKLYLIEINPRFGGGVPLSFEGGANYGKALHNMLNDEWVEVNQEIKQLSMCRYQRAVYYEES